jgi:hypothetical protein
MSTRRRFASGFGNLGGVAEMGLLKDASEGAPGIHQSKAMLAAVNQIESRISAPPEEQLQVNGHVQGPADAIGDPSQHELEAAGEEPQVIEHVRGSADAIGHPSQQVSKGRAAGDRACARFSRCHWSSKPASEQ